MIHLSVLQLYDAALVANKAHAASWHGWGLLEKKQGNYRKARDLWMKVGERLGVSPAKVTGNVTA